MKTTIIAVPTQKAWNDLMKYIEANYPKVRWVITDRIPTESTSWGTYKAESCVKIAENANVLSYSAKWYFKEKSAD